MRKFLMWRPPNHPMNDYPKGNALETIVLGFMGSLVLGFMSIMGMVYQPEYFWVFVVGILFTPVVTVALLVDDWFEYKNRGSNES